MAVAVVPAIVQPGWAVNAHVAPALAAAAAAAVPGVVAHNGYVGGFAPDHAAALVLAAALAAALVPA